MMSSLWERLEYGRAFPLSVMLSLTSRCPLACGHCYLTEGSAADELSLQEIEVLLDDLQELGVLRLTLTGGEPAARSDLDAIVTAAWKRKFVITLKTSASLFDRGDVARLRDLGLAVLHVSLYHVLADEHDRFVGRRGAWRRAVDALEAFSGLGGIAVANTVVMGWNSGAVAELVSFCAERHLSLAVDPKVIRADDGSDRSVTVGATPPDLVAAMRSVPGARRRSQPREPGHEVCTAGESSAYVNSDGEVWLCPALPISIGNIRALPIGRIWEGSELRRRVAAHRWGDSEACMTCGINRFCERCPAEAYKERGDMRLAASADCRVAAAYAEIWGSGGDGG